MVAESSAQRPPSRRGNFRAEVRRAKLAFAAAEAARQSGNNSEYERLVARWRSLAKGIGAS